jgi:starch synthase (maltosyl-transferring)
LAFGDEAVEVHDLLSDRRFPWRGRRAYIELDPHCHPAHIFMIRDYRPSSR